MPSLTAIQPEGLGERPPTMPQSLSRVLVHLVFSTKNRTPFLRPDVRARTFEYLGGALNAIDCPVIQVGGTDDHVHLLFVLGRTAAVSRVVEELKKQSSKWAKRNVDRSFYWQAGYGVFSVSPSLVPKVVAYISNQETHHRKRTFQDEFRAFLKRYEIEFDERYVWD